MKRTAIIQSLARASAAGMVVAGMLVGLAAPAAAETTAQPVSTTAGATTVARNLAAPPPCAEWRLDEDNVIYHSHGWHGAFQYVHGYWKTIVRHPSHDGLRNNLHGDVMFSSATAELVQFTITWDNGSQGEYTGAISPQGFVEGSAKDHNTGATVTWRLRDVAACARR